MINLPSLRIVFEGRTYLIYPRLEEIKDGYVSRADMHEVLSYIICDGRYVCPSSFYRTINEKQTYEIYKYCINYLTSNIAHQTITTKSISLNVDIRFINSKYVEALLFEFDEMNFIFEYYESNIFQNIYAMKQRTRELRENRRVKIWLDNFGTKMANFDLITKLDFDGIKISKELFWDLFFSDKQLLKYLIALMKMKAGTVIIDGIDSLDKFIFCKEFRCLMQGYFFLEDDIVKKHLPVAG